MAGNFELVNNVWDADLVTHDGPFHGDDVLATVLLLKVFKGRDLKICRTRNLEGVPANAVVYDVGNGKFDHHQKGGNGARPNGIKYSSFGLLWKEYGMKLLYEEAAAERIFDRFDEEFVEPIDAQDNGQGQPTPLSLSSIISSFNPTWEEEGEFDACFVRAVEFAEQAFDRKLAEIKSKIKAENSVEKAIEGSRNGIMVLDKYMPWTETVFSSKHPNAKEILYVIFPSTDGSYKVQAVPNALGQFGQRKPLPEEWAGLKNKELSEVSGVKTAIFCHIGRFICGATTLEDAMKLAEIAVNA